MNSGSCPKCGSDQTLNDQCLKCGVIISKFLAASGGMSFVAPQPDEEEPVGYRIPQATIDHQERLKRSKRQTRILGIVIIVLVAIGGFLAYRLVLHGASVFSGEYKNHKLGFVLRFPQENSSWHHSIQDSGLFQGAEDGFWKGKFKPDITLGVWTARHDFVAENASETRSRQLQNETEDEILQMMEEAGAECTLTDVQKRRFNRHPGFRIDADITHDGAPLTATILRAYQSNGSLTIMIVGSPEMMEEHREEVDKIAESLNFRLSMF